MLMMNHLFTPTLMFYTQLMMKMISSLYLFLFLLFLILFILTNTLIHPIIMISLILLNTISICFIMILWQSNFIYPILLFLIMISGLLIIFLYFTSLITNMQNKFSTNFMFLNFIMNIMFLIYLLIINYDSVPPLTPYLEMTPLIHINQNMFWNLFLIYSYPYNNFTLMCILFLLLSMFTIIKMCTIKYSSLRKIS